MCVCVVLFVVCGGEGEVTPQRLVQQLLLAAGKDEQSLRVTPGQTPHTEATEQATEEQEDEEEEEET